MPTSTTLPLGSTLLTVILATPSHNGMSLYRQSPVRLILPLSDLTCMALQSQDSMRTAIAFSAITVTWSGLTVNCWAHKGKTVHAHTRIETKCLHILLH